LTRGFEEKQKIITPLYKAHAAKHEKKTENLSRKHERKEKARKVK
jgi:hypothetical protein